MKQILTYKKDNAVGDFKISAKDGFVIFQANGETVMDFQTIRAVGIADLGDVTEHRITAIVGSRSHLVRFANGGELQYAYNAAGQLIDLIARNLLIYLSKNNEIKFGIPGDQSAGEDVA